MSPSAADLDQLIEVVAQGDRRAFGAIYDAMAPAVFGLVRRVVAMRRLLRKCYRR